jgi:hypothetical protein
MIHGIGNSGHHGYFLTPQTPQSGKAALSPAFNLTQTGGFARMKRVRMIPLVFETPMRQPAMTL